MYLEVKRELDYIAQDNFSGYIRFGVERNEIVAMTVTTIVDTDILNKESKSPVIRLLELCDKESDFFGNLDFVMEMGEIISFNWTKTIKGQQLQSRLLKHKKMDEKNADL